MVATGYYLGYLSSIKVVNLDPSTPNLVCDNLPDFPNSLQGGIGHLFNGTTPIIAAGYKPFEDTYECFALKDGAWKQISSLSTQRQYASSVLVPLENENEVIIVSGGRHLDNLNSVESFNGMDWEQGMFSNMPYKVYQHCLVKINSTTLLSIGGVQSGGVANTNLYQQEENPSLKIEVPNTYFYNIQDNQWTEGPTLNTARGGLSCGILNWKNPETDQFEAIAVAAGGPSDTVELLFLGRGDSPWVMGPSLPYAAGLSTMIEFQNSVILVGGGGGGDGQHLYQLSSPNGTWVEMKQTLKEPREGHVSFLVPDEIVNCH
jgi:hypothetical protein